MKSEALLSGVYNVNKWIGVILKQLIKLIAFALEHFANGRSLLRTNRARQIGHYQITRKLIKSTLGAHATRIDRQRAANAFLALLRPAHNIAHRGGPDNHYIIEASQN